MTKQDVDPRILALCAKVTAKRPRVVIDHILEHGHVTTEELQTLYGYDHPPRAARDVRENGVPLETYRIRSERTGRQIGAYRFADPRKIRRGRIGGRTAFSKKFRDALHVRYDSRDAFTGEKMERRYLQVDHRIPYEVAGDVSLDGGDLEEFMLLDASSQRAKSWSCEHCRNWREDQDADVCRTCFWAFPESHTHVAGQQVRRLDVEWRGDEVGDFDRLRAEAERQGIHLAILVKNQLKGSDA
ncbi:MAG: HNH endonuclease [Gammaproteobacteria bacterium]|nr:HNH endonuclease [Gammaproteobacteria bacterium]